MSSSNTGHTEAAATEPATGPGQLRVQDYAISPKGWAMPIPSGVDGNKVTVLRASEQSYTSTPWEQASKKMVAIGEQPWRNSFDLTPEEHEEAINSGPRRYILVGFALTGLATEHYRVAPSLQHRRPEHNATDSSGLWLGPPTLIPHIESRRIVMVVAAGWQTQLEKNTFLTFQALLRPRSGLCHPYGVNQDECFYLPLFRRQDAGLATSAVGRQECWNHLVRQATDLRQPPKALDLRRASQAEYLPHVAEAAKDTSQTHPPEAGDKTNTRLGPPKEPEGFV